jgi:DNA-binding CsgD family transcriptional regulator
MTVIAVQAGYGHHVIEEQPGQAREALGAIQATSREALADMRRMLGVLRQSGPEPFGPEIGSGRRRAAGPPAIAAPAAPPAANGRGQPAGPRTASHGRAATRPELSPPQVPAGLEQLRELTEREREVLTLVAQGLSNAEIAGKLSISPATAKTHVAHLLTKLDCRDRIQLVIIAYRAGLVPA